MIEDIAKKNRSFYDKFYTEREHLSFETRLLCQNLINTLKDSVSNQKVLEIGFGSGLLMQHILKLSPSYYFGLELSDSALKKAKKTIQADNLKLVDNYAEISNEIFDVIIMSNVIEHIEDDISFLKSLNRFAQDGTIVMLTFPTKYDLDYNPLHFRTYDLNNFRQNIVDNIEVEILKSRYLPPSFITGFFRKQLLLMGRRLMKTKIKRNSNAQQQTKIRRHSPLTYCYFKIAVPFLLFIAIIDKTIFCSFCRAQQGLIIFKFNNIQNTQL